MSHGWFAGLARFVVRFRVLVAVAWGVVLVFATVALPSLGREVNSDPSLFLGENFRRDKILLRQRFRAARCIARAFTKCSCRLSMHC